MRRKVRDHFRSDYSSVLGIVLTNLSIENKPQSYFSGSSFAGYRS